MNNDDTCTCRLRAHAGQGYAHNTRGRVRPAKDVYRRVRMRHSQRQDTVRALGRGQQGVTDKRGIYIRENDPMDIEKGLSERERRKFACYRDSTCYQALRRQTSSVMRWRPPPQTRSSTCLSTRS
jgi:hypothetical protein